MPYVPITPEYRNYTPPVEVAEEMKTNTGLIIGIFAGIFIIAAILCGLFIPSLNNSIKLAVMKPDKYYQATENKFFNGISCFTKSGLEVYQNSSDVNIIKKPASYSGEIAFTPESDFLSKYNIKTLKNVKIKYDINENKDLIDILMKASLNDSELISIKEILDYKKGLDIYKFQNFQIHFF